jgi:hypothetical protein
MIDADLKNLRTPAGLLPGFQVTRFKWRLEQEALVGDKGDILWLVPGDYLSILGMLTLLFRTILPPLADFGSAGFARRAFGLGALFFVGQILGLAGHDRLFNRSELREFVWFATQEKIVISLTALTILILAFILVMGAR